MLKLCAIILNVLAIIVNLFAFVLHMVAGNIIGSGVALVCIALNFACIMVLAEH